MRANLGDVRGIDLGPYLVGLNLPGPALDLYRRKGDGVVARVNHFRVSLVGVDRARWGQTGESSRLVHRVAQHGVLQQMG